MPPGGAGLYFFYISFRLSDQELAIFSITKNGGEACRAAADFNNAGVNDAGMISCGTIQLVAEGSDLSSSLACVRLWHKGQFTPLLSFTTS